MDDKTQVKPTNMQPLLRELPLLTGPLMEHNTRTDIVLLDVWCPYCRKWHQHGWPKGSNDKKPQHRGAHCWGGPFQQHGYLIRPWSKKELLAMQFHAALVKTKKKPGVKRSEF